MTKSASRNLWLFFTFLFASLQPAQAQPAAKRAAKSSAPNRSVAREQSEKAAVARTNLIVREIVGKSYPELGATRIKIKTFASRADYFRSRFSFARFFALRRLDYLILVNPRIFEKDAASDAAVRAIIAHELAHVAYYERHSRFELFGLINLLSNSFAARFERGADLEAVRRGYGAGLKEYREWLYRNVPPEYLRAKRDDYFSPEEIESILEKTEGDPALFDFWRKNVPRSLAAINADAARR